MKRQKIWRWILLAAGIIIALIIAALIFFLTPRQKRIRATTLLPGPGGEINILLIGKDARALNPSLDKGGITRIPREEVAHSDIVIIAHININLNRVTLFAIPRDLLVIVPKVTSAGSRTDFNKMEKLTHTFAIGGEPLLRRTLENLLGIKIHRFIALDFDTFRMLIRTLINYIGPVKLNQTHLTDPDQALKFVRQRNNLPYDDLDRCRNSLNLIKTISSRIWPLADTRLGDILIHRFFDIIGTDTDMTPDEAKGLISSLRQMGFKPEKIQLAVMVSEGRPVTLDRYAMTLSCYLPIYPEMEKQIKHYLHDQDDIPALDFMTQQKYSWPDYMTIEYDLLPDYHFDSLERQRLVKKLLELQLPAGDSRF
ncbi:MAG: LCP family protein [candidate division WOR-3 bacterium]